MRYRGCAREIEHVLDSSGNRISRALAQPAKTPVIFDEGDDRALVGQGVIDKVSLGPTGHQQERLARSISATSLGLDAVGGTAAHLGSG